jgi:WD40 repeat protein
MSVERTTMPRQWVLLKLIPKYPKKTSAREILNKLQGEGFDVTKRTVERDLIDLSRQFPIVSDDAVPIGWSWSKDAGNFDIPGDTKMLPKSRPRQLPSLSKQTAIWEKPADRGLKFLRDLLDPREFQRLISGHLEGFVGREWAVSQFDDWMARAISPLLAIHGPPGIGKSALAASLTACRSQHILASYFCVHQHSRASEDHARDAIKTLTFQLAQRLPEFRRNLLYRQYIDAEKVRAKSADDLFVYLLLEPLAQLELSSQSSRLVMLIDGLDEVSAESTSHNALVDLILNNASRLPKALGVVVTFRAEAELIRRFKPYAQLSMDRDSEQNRSDIRSWLDRQMDGDLPLNRRERLSENYLDKSGGLFLYLRMLDRDRGYQWSDPSALPDQLDGFFDSLFRRYFSEVESYTRRQRPLLELIVSACEPISIATAAQILQWDEYDRVSIITSLEALFPSQGDHFVPFHKSIVDWLTNADKSGGYWVSVSKGEERFGNTLWAHYQQGVSTLDEYGLCHVPEHLFRLGRLQDVRACLTDFKFQMARMEVLRRRGMTDCLVNEYRQLTNTFTSDTDIRAWHGFFQTNLHFLRRGHSEWPSHRILLQRAMETPKTSPIRQAAERFLADGTCDWYWLRSVTPREPLPCVVLDDEFAGPEPVQVDEHLCSSANRKGEIHLWNTVTGERINTLQGHTGVLNGLEALSGRSLVSWSDEDQSLRLWRLDPNGAYTILAENCSGISTVQELASGYIVARFKDATLALWDANGSSVLQRGQQRCDGESIFPLSNGNFVSFKSKGTAEALLWTGKTGGKITSLGFYDGSVQLAELDSGSFAIWSISGDELQIRCQQSGSLLAAAIKDPGGRVTILKEPHGRIVCIRDISTLEPKTLLTIQSWQWCGRALTPLMDVSLHMSDLAANPDCDDVVACAVSSAFLDDGRILLPSPSSLWDGLTGRLLNTLKGEWSILAGQDYFLELPDGRFLTLADANVASSANWSRFYIWDHQGEWLGESPSETPRFSRILPLGCDQVVTWGYDDRLRIWDANDGKLKQILTPDSGVFLGTLSLANGTLMTWDAGHTLRLWHGDSIDSFPQVVGQESINDPHILSFDTRILSYSTDNFPSLLWDGETGQLVATLKAFINQNQLPMNSLAGVIALDEERIVTWGYQRTMYLYNSRDGSLLCELDDHLQPVGGATLMQDGRLISWPMDTSSLKGSIPDSVRIWDVQQTPMRPFVVTEMRAGYVRGVRPLFEGKLLTWDRRNIVSIWSSLDGSLETELQSHVKGITDAGPLANQRVLILGECGTAQIWHPSSQKLVELPLPSVRNRLRHIELSDDSVLIWSELAIYVFDIDREDPLRWSIYPGESDRLIAVHELPDGNILSESMCDRANLLCIWNKKAGSLMGSRIIKRRACSDDSNVRKHGDDVLIRTPFDGFPNDWARLSLTDDESIELQNFNELGRDGQTSTQMHKLYSQVDVLNPRTSGRWIFWQQENPNTIGVTYQGDAPIRCEWHGESMEQFVKLTGDGRVVGFGRRPILLQLFRGNEEAAFTVDGQGQPN